MLNFQDFFNSERTLVTTFSKTLTLTSGKYVVEEGMGGPSKTISKTWITSVALLRFWYRKIAPKMILFEFCLPLREPLVATFDETPALKQICSLSRHEHSKINTKMQISWATLLVFCFRIIALKMLIFEVRLPLKNRW